ncbi:histone deacetylase 11 isoform X4 [Accipiter gentilis]|uniref:histone deacetylase 11 isoform X4 n=1 Tax=Astur gentilis TaxID=8957 RepID=UPI0021101AD9|nr:histone deacetylase 11 isoform X4 [Accipiter gentilis]
MVTNLFFCFSRPHRTELYEDPPSPCCPIVYSPDYNITFMGLEKLHPFDAGKWGKVINFLKVVICCGYNHRNSTSCLSSQFRCSEKSVEASTNPDRRNNNGGGFHHCSSDKGGGFCAYADITLAIKFLFERVQGVSKATIIDLDAHQGNGHERDFMDDHRVYIMDVYNRYIYPGDGFAKRAIKRKVELEWGTEDTEYLQKVHTHVEGALNELKPDIIVYNAGTDILDGDPLGGLAISPQGIVKRDEVVFKAARRRRIPILMVTSGGYQKRTARIIADSILNLHNLGLIDKELATSGAENPKVEQMIRDSAKDLTNLSLQ